MSNRPVVFKVPADLHAAFKAQAKAEGLPMVGLLASLMRSYLEMADPSLEGCPTVADLRRAVSKLVARRAGQAAVGRAALALLTAARAKPGERPIKLKAATALAFARLLELEAGLEKD